MNKYSIFVTCFVIVGMLLTSCKPETPVIPVLTKAVKTEISKTDTPKTKAPLAAEITATATAVEAKPTHVGGNIVFVDNTGFYTLDVFLTPWTSQTQTVMYDSMVTPNLELNGYDCVLCKSYEFVDNDMAIVFHLRDDVKFHDGTPVNAQALKWNYEKYLDPSVGWIEPEFYKSFEVVDEFTLKVNFNTPYAPIFSEMAYLFVVSPTAYEKLGEHKFGLSPVGSGPFIPIEIVENNHVTYKPNPDYKWGPAYSSGMPPKASSFEIKFITDEQVSFAMLESGEATYLNLPAQFREKVKSNPDLKINKGIDMGLSYLGWNHTKPLYQNLKFRQAVSHAVNRDEVIAAGFEGDAFAIASFLPPSSWGYQESQNEYAKSKFTYNPELAKQLLDEAGIIDSNNDGIREFEGKNIDIPIVISTSQDIKRVAETLQGQLEEVGIKLNVTPMESAAQGELLSACEQDMFVRAYNQNDAVILYYMSREGNRNCLKDKEELSLAKVMNTTVDPQKRYLAVENLNKYLVDNAAWIPLWSGYMNYVYRSDMVDMYWDKAGYPHLYDAYIKN